MVIEKITVDSVEVIPLADNDLMNIIIDLAARQEGLKRRIEVLERKLIHVPESEQGCGNPTDEGNIW